MHSNTAAAKSSTVFRRDHDIQTHSPPSDSFSTPVQLSAPSSHTPSRVSSPFSHLSAPDARPTAPIPSAGIGRGDRERSHAEHPTQIKPAPDDEWGAWDEEADEGTHERDDPERDHSLDTDMPSDLRSPSKRGEGRSLLSSKQAGYESPPGSRPALSRKSTFRERSPDMSADSATRTRYYYAGAFLLLSLISFTIQTETAVYIQHRLGWNKAYCML